jgi:hypothetical protein
MARDGDQDRAGRRAIVAGPMRDEVVQPKAAAQEKSAMSTRVDPSEPPADRVKTAPSLSCEEVLAAVLPASGFLDHSEEGRVAGVLATVAPAESLAIRHRLENPSDPLGQRFAWFEPRARQRLQAILVWRQQHLGKDASPERGRAEAADDRDEPEAVREPAADGVRRPGNPIPFLAPTQAASDSLSAARPVLRRSLAASSPEAAFIDRIGPDSFVVTPFPLLVTSERAQDVALIPAIGDMLPFGAKPVDMSWLVVGPRTGAPLVAAGKTTCGPLQPWTQPITFIASRPGTYRVQVDLRAEGVPARRLVVEVTARAPDLDSARSLTDEALEAERAAVEARLAAARLPAERAILLESKNQLEWLGHERSIGATRDPDGDSGDEPEPPDLWQLTADRAATRRALERHIALKGCPATYEALEGASRTLPSEVVAVALEQWSALQAEEAAFRTQFRAAAQTTASQMLEESEAQIAQALRQVGLAVDAGLLNLATSLLLKDEDNIDLAAETILRASKSRKSGQAETYERETARREALVQAARELQTLHQARSHLHTRWLQLESEHPVLAAFRDGDDDLAGLQLVAAAGGEDATRRVLHAVLPKVKNIQLTRRNLGGHVDPLALPPVVELTRQRLHVPPGSVRDRAVTEMVDDARAEWKDWAIEAVTVGLAILTAVPSGGTLVLGAELAGLALDAHLALDAADDHTAGRAVSDTDLDKARSLSQQEPTLAWLAVELVGLPISAVLAAQTFRQAASIRQTRRAGHPVSPAAVDSLDQIGRGIGVENLGGRVADEPPPRAPARRLEPAPGHHALYADVTGELAASNPAALSRRLGVPVEIDDSLATGVTIVFRVDETSQEVAIHTIRAGRAAATADVLAHRRTVDLLRRYSRLLGRLRRWRAGLEVEELGRLVEARREILLRAPTGHVDHILEADIQFLEERIADFESIASELPSEEIARLSRQSTCRGRLG